MSGLVAAAKNGRPCKVCTHQDRETIDRELVAGQAATKALSIRFGVSEQSLSRHRATHLPRAARVEAAGAAAAADGHRGTSLLESASALRDKALAILAKAEQAGALGMALQGIREACRTLELMAKLTGEIDEGVHLNFAIAPALVELNRVVLRALAPYPAAREAVLAALNGIAGPALIEHGRQN